MRCVTTAETSPSRWQIPVFSAMFLNILGGKCCIKKLAEICQLLFITNIQPKKMDRYKSSCQAGPNYFSKTIFKDIFNGVAYQ